MAFEDAVQTAQTAIFVPATVIWEVSLLVQLGTIQLSMPFSDWVDGIFEYQAINPWPLDLETIKIVHGLRFHNDPFDLSIVATAFRLDLPLITNDSVLHSKNPCNLFW